MKILYAVLLELIIFLPITLAQNNGWREPVPIDSTKQFYWPLIAVSPEGQIATIGLRRLIICFR